MDKDGIWIMEALESKKKSSFTDSDKYSLKLTSNNFKNMGMRGKRD